MKTFLIAAVLTCVASACPPPTLRVQSPGLNCTFNFMFYTCNAYSFQSCQMTSFTNGEYTTSSNNNYTICMQMCCSSPPEGDQYDFASQCATNNVPTLNQIPKILLIIVIIFCSAIVLTIITCILWKMCKKKSVSSVQPQNAVEPQNPEINTKIIKCQPSRQELSIQQLLEWKQGGQEVLDTDCVICLGEKPNLKLQCGHKFHPHCFVQWLKKKRECGICRGTKIKNYLLLCQKCFKKQVQISVHDLRTIRKLKQKQTCEDCLSP